MKVPEILVIESQHRTGSLAKICQACADAGLVIENLVAIRRDQDKTIWELTLELDEDVASDVVERINALPTAQVLGTSDRVFNRHRGGKIKTVARHSVETLQELRDLYTPGVARVCLAIAADQAKAWEFTNLPNTVAIITNGTAVLGLGDIGPLAGLPVMEGKAALMANLAGLSGIPILIDEDDPKKIIATVMAIAPSFGAIQLEDFRAPECFEIERELVERLKMPVMHDDQHGTAVVALAAVLSAMGRGNRELDNCVVGQIGLGAAGIGITRLLLQRGVKRVLGTDLSAAAIAHLEALGGHGRSLDELMAESDVVIATTGARGLIKPEMVRPGQMIFALSNPEPEIEPRIALAQGAAFAADGRAINNILGFPGIFRGALDAHATRITDAMLFAAVHALVDAVEGEELVPDCLNPAVHRRVADAVRDAAAS